MSPWMIYGANGYTGDLVARLAARRGLRPVLAGRSAKAVEALAAELGMQSRVFALDDPAAVKEGLDGMALVLNCAGPFSATSRPMLDGCLQTRTHYLDITGEIDVFAACHARDAEGREAGITIMPGVGFDVVPTDCLAAMLAARLPDADSLVLAFEAGGGPSPGTAKTAVQGLAGGGRVRRGGRIVPVPLAWKTMDIPFADGPRHGMTIPWGDVYTAHVSTGIPDIEIYMSVAPATSRRLRRLRALSWLLRLAPVRRFLERRTGAARRGPDSERRASTGCRLWGRASHADGRDASAELHTPNGYELTADAALTIVSHVLDRPPSPGFHTPSQLMGADFVLKLNGVSMLENRPPTPS